MAKNERIMYTKHINLEIIKLIKHVNALCDNDTDNRELIYAIFTQEVVNLAAQMANFEVIGVKQ